MRRWVWPARIIAFLLPILLIFLKDVRNWMDENALLGVIAWLAYMALLTKLFPGIADLPDDSTYTMDDFH